MSKVGALVFEIDEELYELMGKKCVENADLLNLAQKLKVPFTWVAERYEELGEGW